MPEKLAESVNADSVNAESVNMPQSLAISLSFRMDYVSDGTFPFLARRMQSFPSN